MMSVVDLGGRPAGCATRCPAGPRPPVAPITWHAMPHVLNPRRVVPRDADEQHAPHVSSQHINTNTGHTTRSAALCNAVIVELIMGCSATGVLLWRRWCEELADWAQVSSWSWASWPALVTGSDVRVGSSLEGSTVPPLRRFIGQPGHDPAGRALGRPRAATHPKRGARWPRCPPPRPAAARPELDAAQPNAENRCVPEQAVGGRMASRGRRAGHRRHRNHLQLPYNHALNV